MKRKKTPTAIDLFSGAGGLTLGLKSAGFKVLGAVDIETAACESYLMNHPEVHLWEKDVRKLSVTQILSTLKIKKGELDLLSGCPPCQGFSSMRTLNGKPANDKRNDLVFEFLRIAKGLRPKTIMMENVPALAQDLRIKKFTSQLKKLGYHCECHVVNASDYGVPQRRRRMIFLASQNGKVTITHPTVNKRTTVYDAFTKANLKPAGKSGDFLHDFPENRTPEIMKMIEMIPKNGGGRRQLPRKYQLDCHLRYPEGFKDVYGRMSWDDVSPTITGGCVSPSKGRFLHPEENRTITLREAAILQTFPPSYYFSPTGGKAQIALQIGNALPPLFIKFHAQSIKKSLKE